MSLLNLHSRPWVRFQVDDPQHRQWFAEWTKTMSWKNCPVRFAIDDEHGDTLAVIQRRLIQYYSEIEFGKADNS